MLVSITEFKELLQQALKVFVLVELSPGNYVYMGVTKTTINEYLVSSEHSKSYEVEFKDNELFVGCKEN
jgi:hypothetical protein